MSTPPESPAIRITVRNGHDLFASHEGFLDHCESEPVTVPVSPDLLVFYQEIAQRLEGNETFQHLTVNADDSITLGDKTQIDVILCNRALYDSLFDNDQELGRFCIDTTDDDLFSDGSPFAQQYRVFVSVEAADLKHYGDLSDLKIGELYLNTLFHEVEHAKLFMENARFNSPQDIESAYEAGDFNNDLFDCATGYGIRDLALNGGTVAAGSAEEAAALSEVYVEEQGLARNNDTVGFDDLRRFSALLTAMDQAGEPLRYALQCDKLIMRFEHGKALWQAMMDNRQPVDEHDVLAKIDASALLDDGETIHDWLDDNRSSDLNAGWYQSEVEGANFLFYQHSGFEFIFLRDADKSALKLTKEHMKPGINLSP